MAIEITSPVGRIVWGSPTRARDVIDKDTKQPKLKADGTKRQSWSFGVAFDKASFQQFIWPAMSQEVATAYPNGAPGKFAWKYEDGDGIDSNGQPFNLREGYAGCFVLAINTELMAPPVFKLAGNAYQQLPADAIKCGDYVSVGLNFKVNVPTDRTQTPSLYVNPLGIEFVGYGTEIVSTGAVDPMALFKGAQHQLPPGASATPIGGAPGGTMMPGMGMGQPGQMPGAAPGMMPGQPMMQPQPAPMMHTPPPGQMGGGMAPAAQPYPGQPGMMPQPGQMPAPAHDFVQNAGMAQPGQMHAPAPGMAPAAQSYPGQPGMPAPGQMMQPGQMPGMPGGAAFPGAMPQR